MNNISTVTNCANCSGCVNICPKSAIHIHTDDMFYYPVVDDEKCIDCGKCIKCCPVLHRPDINEPLAAFGGWSSEEQLVSDSSSGGIFGALAEQITEDGGVVFGFVFADDCRSVVARSSEQVRPEKMRKSKYVESLPGESFQQIKTALDAEKKALFCAAPCQIAGLHRYLGRAYDALVTCDFACGGLPSHRLYNEYLDELEKKYHSKVVSVDFRPKTHGWERHAIRVCFENGKEYNRLGTEDSYFRCFLNDKLTVRDNCLDCLFSDRHAADITLADFWRHRDLSELENDKGISLILCNTQKGLEAIRSLLPRSRLTELAVEKAAYNNIPTMTDKDVKLRHDAFILSCRESGFSDACKKHLSRSAKQIIKGRIARIKFRKG